MIVRGAALLLVAVLAGCAVPIGRFTAIGDPAGADDATPSARVHGETCRWWILGIPLGVPGGWLSCPRIILQVDPGCHCLINGLRIGILIPFVRLFKCSLVLKV